MKKRINVCGIELLIDYEAKSGTVSSDLHIDPALAVTGHLHTGNDDDLNCFNAAIDAIESLVLAQALEGIDVTTPAYRTALQSALDAITNNL